MWQTATHRKCSNIIKQLQERDITIPADCLDEERELALLLENLHFIAAGSVVEDPTPHVLALARNPGDNEAKQALLDWQLRVTIRRQGLADELTTQAAQGFVASFRAAVGGFVDQLSVEFDEVVNTISEKASVIITSGADPMTVNNHLDVQPLEVIHAWSDWRAAEGKFRTLWRLMRDIYDIGGIYDGVSITDHPWALVMLPHSPREYLDCENPRVPIHKLAADVTFRLAHPDSWAVEWPLIQSLGRLSEADEAAARLRALGNKKVLRSAFS